MTIPTYHLQALACPHNILFFFDNDHGHLLPNVPLIWKMRRRLGVALVSRAASYNDICFIVGLTILSRLAAFVEGDCQ